VTQQEATGKISDPLSSQATGPVKATSSWTVLAPHWTISDWLWGFGQLIRAVRARGQAVTVVVFRPGKESLPSWTPPAGVEVVPLRVRGFWDWRGLHQLGRWFLQRSVPVVLCSGAEATGLAVALRTQRAWSRLAVVALEAMPVGRGLRGWLLSRALRHAERILVPTRASAAEYLELGIPSERLSWIAPVAEIFSPGIAPSGDGPALSSSAQLLAHFCTSEEDSGARQAIVTHEILRYHRPHLQLWIVASSSQQRQRLSAFARRLAVDDLRVHIQTAEQLPVWPTQGTVVLITHRYRCAAVAATAIAHGAVVVGWQMPELAEILDEELARWLVREGQTVELAERVRRLLDHPDQAMSWSRVAQNRASHFTLERMQTLLEGLYNDLVRMKAAAGDRTAGSPLLRPPLHSDISVPRS